MMIDDGSIDHSALQDMGARPIRISDSFRDFMVREELVNSRTVSHFPEDESGRSLTKHRFEKKFQSGEKVHRTWMFFSKKKSAFFRFCCTLFCRNYPNQRSKFNSENGFTTWRNLTLAFRITKIALHIAQHF
jgi:hypothetical protein